MKAIQIRFLPATNFKGARMKAFIDGGYSKTIPFQYELSDDELRARLVAEALMDEMEWHDIKIAGMGQLPNGDYVAVLGNNE